MSWQWTKVFLHIVLSLGFPALAPQITLEIFFQLYSSNDHLVFGICFRAEQFFFLGSVCILFHLTIWETCDMNLSNLNDVLKIMRWALSLCFHHHIMNAFDYPHPISIKARIGFILWYHSVLCLTLKIHHNIYFLSSALSLFAACLPHANLT